MEKDQEEKGLKIMPPEELRMLCLFLKKRHHWDIPRSVFMFWKGCHVAAEE